jgi:thioesterase domain-containing protein
MILDVLKTRPNEPIDIFGWSRGGIAAIALAKRLEKHVDDKGKPAPIKVRFLGLIHPTAPVKRFTEDKDFLDPDLRKLGDNVENAALIVQDGKSDGNLAKHEVYRLLFSVGTITYSKKTNILLNQ